MYTFRKKRALPLTTPKQRNKNQMQEKNFGPTLKIPSKPPSLNLKFQTVPQQCMRKRNVRVLVTFCVSVDIIIVSKLAALVQ